MLLGVRGRLLPTPTRAISSRRITREIEMNRVLPCRMMINDFASKRSYWFFSVLCEHDDAKEVRKSEKKEIEKPTACMMLQEEPPYSCVLSSR